MRISSRFYNQLHIIDGPTRELIINFGCWLATDRLLVLRIFSHWHSTVCKLVPQEVLVTGGDMWNLAESTGKATNK